MGFWDFGFWVDRTGSVCLKMCLKNSVWLRFRAIFPWLAYMYIVSGSYLDLPTAEIS